MKYKSVKGLLKNDESLIPVTFIDKLEDILHGFLGIILFVISVLAVGYSLQRLIETRPFFPLGMIQAINDILFVVIILEIMRTVIVRFTDGIFQLDNFLLASKKNNYFLNTIGAYLFSLFYCIFNFLQNPFKFPMAPARL